MTGLWFVVPAHGRDALTAICLRQLRRTCDQLTLLGGIHAEAVVVACDENLDTARELGFGTVERDNRFLSRRFNDGIQLACDPEFNPRPADYVVPCGSDDWVDWRLFLELPRPTTMIGFQHMAFVREDGRELTVRQLRNEGGCGIRIYPAPMLAKLGYRPADEDRTRGCDTSILVNLKQAGALRLVKHRSVNPLSIVDWKTRGENVNPYQEVAGRHRATHTLDPWEALSELFPADAIEEMADHYADALVAA